MLVGLSKRYLGSDYSVKKNNVGQVTADMIDMVSVERCSLLSRDARKPVCVQLLNMARDLKFRI